VSPSSPERGSANRRGRGRRDERDDDDEDEDEERPLAPGGKLIIPLEHQRYRHLAWMSFGLVAGLLLLLNLGTVGQWLGVVLMLVGAWASYNFVRTLLFPAGTIVVGDDGVELPRGLCKGPAERFRLGQIAHVYLLRRSVPWTRAAPVLVVETADRAFTYPRDWFLTEADQRRVVRELHNRSAGREVAGEDAKSSAATPETAESA
jgi:hypothetical protein